MKVCHYLPGDIGDSGYPEIVNNGDMGEGGPINAIFAVTSFLNGAIHHTSAKIQPLYILYQNNN